MQRVLVQSPSEPQLPARPRSRVRSRHLLRSLALAITLVGASSGQAEARNTPPRDGRTGTAVRSHRPLEASVHLAHGYGQPSDASDLEWPNSGRKPPEGASRDSWPEQWKRPELPIRWNQRTNEYLRHFSQTPGGRRQIEGWFERGAKYLPYLRRQLRDAGLPADLVFVAMVESGLNPTRSSRAGAAGLWQFMPGTASAYELEKNHWIDERFDPLASTRASTALLSDLQARFGGWELVLAAYHAGFGRVLTAMKRANSNDFWTLARIENGLPLQTLNYPAKVLALAIVAANPERFGISELVKQFSEARTGTGAGAEPRGTVVQVRAQTRLDRLARAIEVEPALMHELNARYIRGRTPPSPAASPIVIPASALARFQSQARQFHAKNHPQTPKKPSGPGGTSATDSHHGEFLEHAVHQVRLGESLQQIAAEHGSSVREIRKINGVRDAGELRVGTSILVPGADVDHSQSEASPPLAPLPDIKVPPGMKRIVVRFNRASTVRELALRAQVSWPELVTWNGLDPAARIFDGQLLQLVVPRAFDPHEAGLRAWELDQVRWVCRGTHEHLEASTRDRELTRRSYRVRPRDTWRRLERRFGLSRGSIARLNRMRSRAPLVPGSRLLLYLPDHKTRGTARAPEPALYADWLAESHWPKQELEADCRPGPDSPAASR